MAARETAGISEGDTRIVHEPAPKQDRMQNEHDHGNSHEEDRSANDTMCYGSCGLSPDRREAAAGRRVGEVVSIRSRPPSGSSESEGTEPKIHHRGECVNEGWRCPPLSRVSLSSESWAACAFASKEGMDGETVADLLGRDHRPPFAGGFFLPLSCVGSDRAGCEARVHA